jgi:uncharacterized protein (DUF2336 family)
MLQGDPLFLELEATLRSGSGSQRFTILRRITDLFQAGSDMYTDEQVGVFDDFIMRLIEKIERQALIELSAKFAPLDRAPVTVIGRLSRDDDIEIAGPVLEKSKILTDDDLIEVAKTKSQAHLAAIADRETIGEPVTDVLIDRGDSRVAHKATSNAGARFSRFGLAQAVRRAASDESVAMAVANRMDVPTELLDHLIRKATTAVRERLLAGAPPEMKKRITEVLHEISKQVSRSVAPIRPRVAGGAVLRDDAARIRSRISRCVENRDVEGLIDALAIHCEIPVRAVRNIVRQGSSEGLLVLGKSSGIGWPELQGILAVVLPERTNRPAVVHELFEDFIKLTPANAERAVRYIRASAANSLEKLKELV